MNFFSVFHKNHNCVMCFHVLPLPPTSKSSVSMSTKINSWKVLSNLLVISSQTERKRIEQTMHAGTFMLVLYFDGHRLCKSIQVFCFRRARFEVKCEEFYSWRRQNKISFFLFFNYITISSRFWHDTMGHLLIYLWHFSTHRTKRIIQLFYVENY